MVETQTFQPNNPSEGFFWLLNLNIMRLYPIGCKIGLKGTESKGVVVGYVTEDESRCERPFKPLSEDFQITALQVIDPKIISSSTLPSTLPITPDIWQISCIEQSNMQTTLFNLL